jgi:hypothetical protein
MQHYRGGGNSDDDDDDEEDNGSPMQLSRGTATPLYDDPASGGRGVPWITDEQDIVPTGGGSHPEWMTRSQDASPAQEEQPPRKTKKRLDFGAEGGNEDRLSPSHWAEDSETTLPAVSLPPVHRAPLPNLVPSSSSRGARDPFYDVDPWGDVDFLRLAREQADQAERMNRPQPGDKFLSAAAEYPQASGRLERVMRNMLSRVEHRPYPLVVLYAAEPDLDPRVQPVMLWRSAPGKSHVHLQVAILNHSETTRLDATLAIDGPASIETTRVLVHTQPPDPVHLRIRSDSVGDMWRLEGGSLLPPERICVVLIQENSLSEPQVLDLTLMFAQASVVGGIGAPTEVAIENHLKPSVGSQCSPDDWTEIRYVDSFQLEITLRQDGKLTWEHRHHPLSRWLVAEPLYSGRVDPAIFRRLVCADTDKFLPGPKPRERNEPADKSYMVVEKVDVGGTVYTAPMKSVAKLARDLKALAESREKSGKANE